MSALSLWESGLCLEAQSPLSLRNDYVLVRGKGPNDKNSSCSLTTCFVPHTGLNHFPNAVKFHLTTALSVRCFYSHFSDGKVQALICSGAQWTQSRHLNPGLSDIKAFLLNICYTYWNIDNSWWPKTRKDQQKNKFISRVRRIQLEARRLHLV